MTTEQNIEAPFEVRVKGKKILCQGWLSVKGRSPKLLEQRFVKASKTDLPFNRGIINFNSEALKEGKKHYTYDYDVKTGFPLPFMPFTIEQQSRHVAMLSDERILSAVFKTQGLDKKLFFIIAIACACSTVSLVVVLPLALTWYQDAESVKADNARLSQQVQELRNQILNPQPPAIGGN